jgi:GGDEF domain-containing protein
MESHTNKCDEDEIMALLRSDADQATAMAERIRKLVAQESTLIGEVGAPRTLTAAILPLEPKAASIPETILSAAREQARDAFAIGSDQTIRLPALKIPAERDGGTDPSS